MAGHGASWSANSDGCGVKASLEAPLTKGAVVGKVLATSNGKTVSEAPLVAQADVERSGLLLRGWQHVTKLFGK